MFARGISSITRLRSPSPIIGLHGGIHRNASNHLVWRRKRVRLYDSMRISMATTRIFALCYAQSFFHGIRIWVTKNNFSAFCSTISELCSVFRGGNDAVRIDQLSRIYNHDRRAYKYGRLLLWLSGRRSRVAYSSRIWSGHYFPLHRFERRWTLHAETLYPMDSTYHWRRGYSDKHCR